jgi:hypothetical protein
MNDGFDQPTEVTDVLVAFPASVAHLMPAMAAIPEDFRRERGNARPWIKLQCDWIYAGLPEGAVTVKAGIDEETAWRHLACVQYSFEPKHEHKIAAVAWLMSRWFDLN